MISSTSCPWAWTQSSRSTPTSSMHNLSFTPRFRKIVGQKIYLAKYQKSKTRGNSRVHTDYGRHKFNPSGHFYESIQPSAEDTSSKAEYRSQSRWYNLPKVFCIRENSQDFGCEGHCRITTQQWIWRFTIELMWVSVINQMKKGMQRHRLI